MSEWLDPEADQLCKGCGYNAPLKATSRSLMQTQESFMEHVQISLDDGTGAKFDDALRDTLPDGGDLRVITKDAGTVGGRPVVMLAFTVELPDGSRRRAQTVTTGRQILAIAAAIRGRYGEID